MNLPLHELAALGAAACWAFTGTVVTGAIRQVGAFRFNMVRHGFVITLLVALVLVLGRTGGLDWMTVLLLALSGLMGIFIGDTLNFAAVGRLGPRRGGAVFALNAPMAALLGWLLLDETLTGQAVSGILLSTLGVAVAIMGRPSQNAHTLERTQGVIAVGIGFGLAAALGQASGSLIARPALAAGLDPYLASLIRVMASGLCMGVVAGAGLVGLGPLRQEGKATQVSVWQREILIPAIATAVIGLGLGMTLLMYALQGGKVGIVSTLSATSPVIILPLLWLKTGQRPSMTSWLGALICVVGLALIFLR